MSQETREFDRYPHLSELVPKGGRPGCVYALIPTFRLGDYQKDGWKIMSDPITLVGIEGPVDAILVRTGEPIDGASPEAGTRVFMIDTNLDRLTGLGGKGHGSQVKGKKAAEQADQPAQG